MNNVHNHRVSTIVSNAKRQSHGAVDSKHASAAPWMNLNHLKPVAKHSQPQRSRMDMDIDTTGKP